jgi:6-phosphogluconolactonase (cycloisomerase 2 family)
MFGQISARALVAIVCASVIAGCSGGRSSIPSAPVADGASALVALPSLLPDSGSAGPSVLLVSNGCGAGPAGNGVLSFPITASGNVAPNRTLLSNALNQTYSIAVDGKTLWATDYGTGALLAFDVNTNGTVTPSRKIEGSNIGAWGPSGVVVDPSTGEIFVTDPSNSRIVVFGKDATGNATPKRIIKGTSTTLYDPQGIILAPSSQIAVVDANPVSGGGVDFFSETANGNVAPVTRIAGTATNLQRPEAAALFGGNLYVSNSLLDSISVFANGAHGNVAPIHTIGGAATGIHYPWGIGFDAKGDLYVANSPLSTNTVTVYGPGASGNVAPTATLAGAQTGFDCPSGLLLAHVEQLFVPDTNNVDTFGLDAVGYDIWMSQLYGSSPPLSAPRAEAFDAGGNMYVADNALNAVLVYAPGAAASAAPIRAIRGAATGLVGPQGIGLDSAGNVYVSNTNSVTVYAPGANGNVAPIRTVTGSKTKISKAQQLYVRSTGAFYVASSAKNAVLFFKPGATGNVAPARTLAGASTGFNKPTALTVDIPGRIYEADLSGTQIRVFASGASGNTAPNHTIGGPSSGFNGPRGLTTDASGDIYMSNCSPGAEAVFVFAKGASGDAVPIRELGGADSRFSCPWRPAVF